MINLNLEKELISKEAILREFQDIEVYQRYIDFEIKIGGKPVKSPLRDEETPSFGFFIGTTGEVCFKDFKLGAGDFVKFVMMKFGVTYFEALSQIALDLGLKGDYICKPSKFTPNNYSFNSSTKREDILTSANQVNLNKRSRPWMLLDRDYWGQFGIGLNTLKKFNVEAIDYIFVDDKPFAADNHAYCFTEHKDGVETYKIYQPFNKKYKWMNSHDNSVWQGWEQLPESGDELIITKSLKDVMALYEVCGLPAVSLQSENLLPKKHVFEQLTSRFKEVVLLYDNDYDKEVNWGKTFGDKIAREFGLMDCYIHERHECKDFSDLVKKFGPQEAADILRRDTLLPF